MWLLLQKENGKEFIVNEKSIKNLKDKSELLIQNENT